jgi:hypothetical protein
LFEIWFIGLFHWNLSFLKWSVDQIVFRQLRFTSSENPGTQIECFQRFRWNQFDFFKRPCSRQFERSCSRLMLKMQGERSMKIQPGHRHRDFFFYFHFHYSANTFPSPNNFKLLFVGNDP